MELLEISLVTWPANELATVTGYKSAKGGTEPVPDTEEKPGKPEKPKETEKAAQIDIDSALLYCYDQTLTELVARGKLIHSDTIAAYNDMIRQGVSWRDK